ncbi:hypothetical protein MMYC01_202203 [Madurella mycetomatis]|uniref:Uncharacterized protein n=1 Tax=Madurella mycetomatis TaxID=100816 RepID=A0A175WER7_9PEZI|nr:hypothetical protein MMYC01_202203 [Madurella mycetomatis]
MAAEADKVTQQEQQPAAPAAETQSLKVLEVGQEGLPSGGKSEDAGTEQVAAATEAAAAKPTDALAEPGPAPASNGVKEMEAATQLSSAMSAPHRESKLTTAADGNLSESAEPAALPIAASATSNEGLDNAAQTAPAERTAEEPTESGKNPAGSAETPSVEEVLPDADAIPVTATANGEQTREKKDDADVEMKEADETAPVLAAAAETVAEDGVTAPALDNKNNNNKRKAGDAFAAGTDASADTETASGGQKRAKTETETEIQAANEANENAKVTSPRAETRTAPTRKPGRPKKQAKAPPVVGRTARKTRSQGPVEV